MRLNSQAVALLMILTMILLLISLIAIGMNFALTNTRLSYHILDNTKAFYFAEAGIQRAMFKIKNSDFTYEPWPFAGQTVAITITDLGSNNYGVLSTCTYKSSNKQLGATIKKGSTVSLEAWQQLN